MNGYELSRKWFDFCFENPEKIKPNHTAIYFFAIEHCNRLGWKPKFGFPTTMAMETIGIKSYNTFSSSLNEIVEWGFIKIIEKSRNQYSSNIIALSNFNKALDKALDKALIKHTSKQSESTIQSTSESTSESISSIDKQVTIEPIEQINKEQVLFADEESATSEPVNDIFFETEETAFTETIDAEPKKKKEKVVAAKKEPSVFSECMDIYCRFIKFNNGVPVINALAGKSLKEIIAHLKTASIDKGDGQDKEVTETFYGILRGYKRWQVFHQGQTKLNQISSNLQDIILAVNNPNQLQNGKSTSLYEKSNVNPFKQC